MSCGEKFTKKTWILIHDILAHPICGLFWILDFHSAGDWLHEKTVHSTNYEDERWSPPQSQEIRHE